IPVIIFPTAAKALSGKADAIYFMSMLNSKDIGKIIGEQVLGAPYVKKAGLETLPMGYVIVEPGMTVGKVGKADPIPRDRPETAVNYALAAQYLGMKFFYLEAGSGAPEPVPEKMIQYIKDDTDMTVIVGGGIRKPEQARKLSEAGADIIVTGTVIEESEKVHQDLKKLISAIKI
ncbi:MAG: geranylgeranylglyceryl/heptaprenylglyceryl phosphate synthase, partial [Thermoplasmatota archaeon]